MCGGRVENRLEPTDVLHLRGGRRPRGGLDFPLWPLPRCVHLPQHPLRFIQRKGGRAAQTLATVGPTPRGGARANGHARRGQAARG